MILIDTKVDKSISTSKINLPLLDAETTTLSFSDLLNSIDMELSSTKKQNFFLKDKLLNTNNKDLKDISSKLQGLDQDQDKDKEEKQNFVNSFLNIKNLQKTTTDILNKDILALNPKVLQETDTKEIKLLITNAKEYLKNKILSSEDYKRSTLKELPNTLSGLKELAKVYDVNVSKITLEEVQSKFIDTKMVKKDNSKVVLQKENTQEIAKTKPVGRVDAQKAEPVQNELKKDNSKVVLQKENIQERVKTKPAERVDAQKAEPVQHHTQKTDNKILLFKEALDSVKIQHTTEQLVQIKQQKPQNQEQKQKKENTLNSLLSGEKVVKQEILNDITTGVMDKTSTLTISSTTKVLPSTISLESILQENMDDVSSEIPESKTTIVNVHKADSFEVKLNEAKQMVKYISQDIKQSIDEYKSPFTRIKLQLNPKNMGEVDLTVVQRGKNLHINLSSNNVAINTLAQNVNELKLQLNNNGINNASLNFSNNSQSSDSSFSGQQNSQQQSRAKDEYNYFEKEENSEDIVSSLEIIVPHYA